MKSLLLVLLLGCVSAPVVRDVPAASPWTDTADTNLLTIVTYGAEWCPACLIMKSTLTRFRAANPNVTFFYVDIDSGSAAAHGEYRAQYVRRIPHTFLFYKNRASYSIEGSLTFDQLNHWAGEFTHAVNSR